MSNNKISELRPRPVQVEPAIETAMQPRRQNRRSKHSRTELRTMQRLQIAIVILVGLLIVAGLSVVMSAKPLRAERDILLEDVLRLERDLTLANEEIARLTAERDELVTTRIPGLQPLVFDETIEVDKGYVRNVLFTLTVQGGSPAFEFRVVLSNEDLVDVIPDVAVLLFNELGVQVGNAVINPDTLVDTADGPFRLKSGDVRSFSGEIELVESAEPKYYVVKVD